MAAWEEIPFTVPPHAAAAARCGRAVLAFTRVERKLISGLRPGGVDVKPILGGLTNLTVWPDMVLAGPILGAPQAAMVMETLGRGGAVEFLSLGWCGALRSELGWGDVILPVSALSEEGTSAHYRVDDRPPGPDPGLSRKLALALEKRGRTFYSGRIWTTDAPFRETRAKAVDYGGRGLLGVDMETSALMSVAAFRGWRWAGLLVVSDTLHGEEWRPGFGSAELKRGLTRASEAILDVLSGD
jgi:uridine phosphorylase